jgi:hypothetical protein
MRTERNRKPSVYASEAIVGSNWRAAPAARLLSNPDKVQRFSAAASQPEGARPRGCWDCDLH